MIRLVNLSPAAVELALGTPEDPHHARALAPYAYHTVSVAAPLRAAVSNPELDGADTRLLLLNDHGLTVAVLTPGAPDTGAALIAPGASLLYEGPEGQTVNNGLVLDLRLASRLEHLDAIGALYRVNEYLTNRAYGGPEEGGWYFDVGTFETCHGTFESRDQAVAARRRLGPYLEEARQGRYPPSSVSCNGWPVLTIESRNGRDYPAARPVYA